MKIVFAKPGEWSMICTHPTVLTPLGEWVSTDSQPWRLIIGDLSNTLLPPTCKENSRYKSWSNYSCILVSLYSIQMQGNFLDVAKICQSLQTRLLHVLEIENNIKMHASLTETQSAHFVHAAGSWQSDHGLRTVSSNCCNWHIVFI